MINPQSIREAWADYCITIPRNESGTDQFSKYHTAFYAGAKAALDILLRRYPEIPKLKLINELREEVINRTQKGDPE